MEEKEFETIEELRASGQLEDYLKQVGSMNLLEDAEVSELAESEDDEVLATMYEYLLTVLEEMDELTPEEATLVNVDRIKDNIAMIEKYVEFVDEDEEVGS